MLKIIEQTSKKLMSFNLISKASFFHLRHFTLPVAINALDLTIWIQIIQFHQLTNDFLLIYCLCSNWRLLKGFSNMFFFMQASESSHSVV